MVGITQNRNIKRLLLEVAQGRKNTHRRVSDPLVKRRPATDK